MFRRLSAFAVPAGLLIFSVVASAQSRPQITNSTLANGEVTVSYVNQSVQETGGIGTLTWSKTSGNLPTGLTLDQTTGAITGTPTAIGQYTFTIQVTDSQSQMSSQQYTVQIFTAISITTTTLPNGAFGDSYSQSLSTSGGSGSLTWSILSGALPNNVTLNSSTGLISGTASAPNGFPPNTAEQINVTIGVVDALGGTASQFYAPLINTALAVGITSLPVGVQNTPYNQSLVATGGSGTLTWSTGSLPEGLMMLDTSTGAITGTPTSYGTYSINVTVTDSNGGSANQSVTLAIDIANRVITTNLPNGMAIVNISGTQDGAASSNSDQTIWYQPVNSNEPAQLLEYTVPAGPYTFRIIDPTDAASIFPSLAMGQLGEIWTSWTYNTPWVTPYLVFPSTAATNSSVGQLFSGAENFGGSGFTGANATQLAYNDAITNGYYNELFTGTRNNGSPVAQYTFASQQTLIFTVPDNGLSDNSGGISVLIAPVAATPISLTGATLTAGQAGTAYGPVQVTGASGGSGNYVWSVSSSPNAALPAGLTLSATGLISGTPTVTGNFTTVLIFVTDPVSGARASALFSITISAPANPLTITTTSPLPAATLNSAYHQTICATGGAGSYTWSMTPVGGLTIASTTGVLSGTITTPGTYTLNVTVMDGASDQTSQQFTVSAFGITTTSLPAGVQGESYTQTVAAPGGSGSVSWSISGSLPFGLGLNTSTGAIIGIPVTVTGPVSFTLTATDAAQHQAQQAFQISVTKANQVSYVVLNHTTGGLVRVSADGQTVTPISAAAQGYGVAVDASGNFIVANVGSLQRITPDGTETTIATAPGGSQFLAVAVDGAGNFIVGDNEQHEVWRVSPDGSSVLSVANYPVAVAGNLEGIAVTVDIHGNYIVAEDNNSSPQVSLFSITPGGTLTPIGLSGTSLPTGAGSLAFDHNGNYMLLDYNQDTLFQITPAGVTTVFATNAGRLGLARNPVTNDYVTGGTQDVLDISATGASSSVLAQNSGLLANPEAIVTTTGDFITTVDATNPLAYFRLQGTAGPSEANGYAYGLSPTGATLAPNGAPVSEVGENSALLDGQSGEVITTLTGQINTAGSMMAWINLAALPSAASSPTFNYIAGESAQDNDFDLQINSSNVLGFYTTCCGDFLSYTPNPATLVNQWHMIVATFDAAAGTRALYWDGALVASDNCPQCSSYTNKTGAFWIGNTSNFEDFGNRYFNGAIDEVAAWNYSLTASQVYTMYSSRPPGNSGAVVSLSPATTPLNSSAIQLTINGQSFSTDCDQSPCSTVWWTAPNGSTSFLTPTSITSNRIQVSVPAPLLASAGVAQVSVVNSNGVPTNRLPFTIAAPPLGISPSSLPDATAGQEYSQNLTVSGGAGPFTWTILSQSTGLNLHLHPSTGSTVCLKGTPDISGEDLQVVVQVTDTSTGLSFSQNYSLTADESEGVSIGLQPIGTTAYILNDDQSLVSVTGGNGTTLASGVGCDDDCTVWDMTRDAAGNFIGAAGNQIIRFSVTGAPLDPINLPGECNVTSIAIDAAGNYIVVDTNGHRILTIQSTAPYTAQVVASYAGYVTHPDAEEYDAYLRRDSSGNYILAEDNNFEGDEGGSVSLFQITPAMTPPWVVTPIALSGSAIPQGIGGMTFDSHGNYVVVDWFNDAVDTITPSGATTALFTDSNEFLEFPLGIARDPLTGLFFLVDDCNDALYTLTSDGATLTQIASGGVLNAGPVAIVIADASGPVTTDFVLQNNGSIVPVPAGQTVSCSPQVCGEEPQAVDLTLDAAGNFIAANGSKLVKITRAGVSSVINTAPEGSNWRSVAIDSFGNFIVADNGLHRVVRISPDGQTITPVASYMVANSDTPKDAVVRVDGQGNYIVAEDNGSDGPGPVQIYKITPTGTVTNLTLSGSVPNTVGGMTFDAQGNYVVTDWQAAVVDVVNATTGAVSVLFNNPNRTLDNPLGIYRDLASSNYLMANDGDGDQDLYLLSSDGTQLTLLNGNLNNPVAVVSASFAVTTPSLPSGIPNQAYTPVTMTATGGSGSYTWSATDLPAGLTISAAGVISGMPTGASQSSVTVFVTDTSTNLTAGRTYSLIIATPIAPPITTPLTIPITSLPNAALNQAYNTVTLGAAGGAGGYSWSATGLPAGMTLSSTGALSGTPTIAGMFTVFASVQDKSGASATAILSLTVGYPPLSIATSVLPNGAVGQIYGPVAMAATGGSGSSNYTWSMVSSPPGVAITPAGAVSSAAALLPLAAGTYSTTVTVTDAKANLTAAQKYTIVIAPGPLTPSGPSNLGGFAPGAAVSAAYSATGGKTPYTWAAVGLPTGLALDPSAGTLTGSISAPGNYAFQVQVTDSQAKSVTASVNVSLFVLGIATTSLPNGTVKSAYSQTLSAAGGSPPYSWSVSSGTLPAGLSLSPSGVLSGTPTADGTIPPAGITSSFTVAVANGGVTASAPLTLTVTSNLLPLKTAGGPLPDGNASTPYSQTLEASNGKPPYSWSLLGGTLPSGLSLDSSGNLTGTPNKAGSYAFTGQVTDTAGGSASGSFTITIDPQLLTITTGSQLPNGIVSTSYPTQVITAKGGTPPYTFKAGGTLPDGLVFSDGQLTGTPTTNTDSSFTVTVTDSAQPMPATATAPFQISIEPFHTDLVLSEDLVQLSMIAGAQTLPASTSSASVTVSSNAQGLSYSVTPDSATWLDVTSPGATPGAIGISLDPANAPKLAAGNYSSSITVACVTPAGASQPSPCAGDTQTVTVSLSVTAAPPQLVSSPDVLSFSVQSADSEQASQILTLQNAGGGTISGISVTSPDSFVTISNVPQTISAAGSAYVTIAVNPAGISAPLSQSTVTVTTSAGSVNVPLTLLIAQKPTLTLIPAGTQFQTQLQNSAVAPLGNSAGSFQVSVSGTTSVSWTAAVLPGANWLQLSTTSGASTGSNPGTVNYSVNVSQLPVIAQPNYGTIRVTSSSVSDPTQDFLVVLNVASAANPVQPSLTPAGLVFITNGSGALPPQTVQVSVSSTTPVTYSAAPNAAWLQVSPASDSVSSAAADSSSVSVNLAGLTPGTYTGEVSYQLAASGTGSGVTVSNAVRSVNVTLIVQGAGAAASGRSGPTPKAACAPAQLIPTQTGLVNNFSQPASWPTPLAIQLADNCGNLVTNGQIVATFSNGDPPLALTANSTASGVYSGTWTPRSTAGQITIAARATAQGFPAATAQIAGQVTPNAAPILNPNGTLNVFAPVVGAPLAPGAIVQIYGSNLAALAAPATTIPLPTNINQTSVIIGGMLAPLYYVSPGQINAQVPFELSAGSPYQLIVSANGALSTPSPIQLASAAPGIAQYPAGQIIAQHLDESLVTETSPATPGEYIVFYIAGMGQTNQNITSGTASPSGDNLATPLDTPTLTVNGEPVTNVLFAGLTPTLVGLYQIDFQVPADAPNGDLPLVLTQTSGFSNSSILPVQAPAQPSATQ